VSVLSIFKRTQRQSPPAKAPATGEAECIFSLDQEKKRLYLLDLRSVLRTNNARRALPNLDRLEITISRCTTRVRIPHSAMRILIKEIMSVEKRLLPASPIFEIVDAIPGSRGIAADPVPTSIINGTRAFEVIAPPTTPEEIEMAAADIRSIIQNTNIRSVDKALAAHNRQMSGPMTTTRLPDHDLAGYIDLCQISGEHGKVINILSERVKETPAAWIWIRLLSSLEAVQSPLLESWRHAFMEWASKTHPDLIPDMLAAVPAGECFHGLLRDKLFALDEAELRR